MAERTADATKQPEDRLTNRWGLRSPMWWSTAKSWQRTAAQARLDGAEAHGPGDGSGGFTRLAYEIEEGQGGLTKLTGFMRSRACQSWPPCRAAEAAGGGWSWVLSGLKMLLETGTSRLTGHGEALQVQGRRAPFIVAGPRRMASEFEARASKSKVRSAP